MTHKMDFISSGFSLFGYEPSWVYTFTGGRVYRSPKSVPAYSHTHIDPPVQSEPVVCVGFIKVFEKTKTKKQRG